MDGLVKDKLPNRRQKLGHSTFSDHRIGKEKMVVDDDHVGCHGHSACQVDAAGTKLRAFGTEAVFTGGGSQRQPRWLFIQIAQFGKVTGARVGGPAFDLRQLASVPHARCMGIQWRMGKAMLTQVTDPALEPRHSDRQSEAFGDLWQVTSRELILKRLGRR